MPRNGDGSSDNGPVEGHEIVHGVSGNDTLQHTKHVAPMPDVEAGDSLPGMGAGGVADVTQGDSEEFRTNEPKKDTLAADGANTTSASRDSSSRPSAPKRQKTGSADDSASQADPSSSSASQSGANHSHSSASASSHAKSNTAHEASSDLDQIARHKAEKYVNLDNDEVKLSAASTEHDKREARAERRADALGEGESASSKGDAQKERYGDRADVESLHGATGTSKSGGGKTRQGNNEGRSEKTDGGQSKGGKGRLDEGNDLEKVQRHQAEKFGAVNLQNE